MIFRLISGTVALGLLVGTVLFAQYLLAREPDAMVFLAGYMGIGGILLGAYLLFYAMTGKWRPNLTSRNKTP
jgi:hypothetical protein